MSKETRSKGFCIYRFRTHRNIMSDMQTLVAQLGEMDLTITNEIQIVAFAGLGVTNSHKLRENLQSLMDKNDLSSPAKLFVYFFALLKSMASANTVWTDSKESLSFRLGDDSPTFRAMEDAIEFINSHCTEHAYSATAEVMPFANISTANPSLTAMLWKKFHRKIDGTVMTAENQEMRYIQMMNNLWFGQLSLDSICQKEHRKWEEEFWNKQIIGTKGMGAAAYESGFNEEYYSNKKSDRYPLLKNDLTHYQPGTEYYSKDFILAWYKS